VCVCVSMCVCVCVCVKIAAVAYHLNTSVSRYQSRLEYPSGV